MKKIILSGGGTLGSVSPLVALYKNFTEEKYDLEFLWVGTHKGPEAAFVRGYGIPYRAIPAGKFRRYASLKNIFDPLLVLAGFAASFFLLIRYRPNVIVSAGGYVSVPLVWAGWILRIPALIHQQDARVGLANKLMAPFARRITSAFERGYKYFGTKKCVVIGNPVRSDLYQNDKAKALVFFGFSNTVPTILVLGGGTGAQTLNRLVMQTLENLVQFCQIIHATGKGKMATEARHSRYRSYEFLDAEAIAMAYAASDLVVSRAGMSTLTELAYLQKPVVVIPIPGTHQEDNAHEFTKHNACELLNQKELDPKSFSQILKDMVYDSALLHELSKNIGKVMPRSANRKIMEEVLVLMK